MKGPIGTVRFMHEHGGVGHISPDNSGPLEVWVGTAWVSVAELIDDHERLRAIQTVFRLGGAHPMTDCEDTAWAVARTVIDTWTELLNDQARPMTAALPTLKGLIAAAVADVLETVRIEAFASALEDNDR